MASLPVVYTEVWGVKVDKVCCHTQSIWGNRGLQICYGIGKGKHFKDLSYQVEAFFTPHFPEWYLKPHSAAAFCEQASDLIK